MSGELVVLDASPILNILGSGSPELILAPFEGLCVVEEKTLAEVRRDPFDGSPAEKKTQNLVTNGHLKIARMGGDSYELYLRLVGAESPDGLGRGESAALAYASETGGIVVLDDRKARRIGSRMCPTCVQWTSIELFRRGLTRASLPIPRAAEIVRLALLNARMHVFATDRPWLDELGI